MGIFKEKQLGPENMRIDESLYRLLIKKGIITEAEAKETAQEMANELNAQKRY